MADNPTYEEVNGPVPAGPVVGADGLAQQTSGGDALEPDEEAVPVAEPSFQEVNGPAFDPAKSGGGAAAPTAETEERKPRLSALRDNIAAKGQYSYYYGHTNDTPAVRAEREAALRIQQAQAAGGAGTPVLKTKVAVARSKKAISQYSWSDGKKRVTVYIPTQAFDIPEDQDGFSARAEVTHTPKGVQFLLTDNGGQQHLFAAPRLYDEITKAVVKYAPEKNRISLLLTKKSGFTWASLQRAK